LETQIGDFLGCGVNLLVVVSVEFVIKNPLGLVDLFDIFSDTGADESVLEPTVGSFHFTFGLRGQGISDFDITIFQNLFPLRGGFIGKEVVFSPERIPSLDESEDAMGVYVVSVRESMAQDHGLEGQDMGPAGLLLDQNSVEHESAIIIQRCDKIPFFFGSGSPEMMRGVMLDQFPNIMGYDFPIMGRLFGFLQIEPMLFSPVNNRRQGNLLMVGNP
jgi:hypothetical protein